MTKRQNDKTVENDRHHIVNDREFISPTRFKARQTIDPTVRGPALDPSRYSVLYPWYPLGYNQSPCIKSSDPHVPVEPPPFHSIKRAQREALGRKNAMSAGIDPALEIYGATLMSQIAGMSVVLVLYDCLLTLDDEVCVVSSFMCHCILLTASSQVRFVWSTPLHWPSALYYIDRYVSIGELIFTNYRQ
jgi:hypothetical protein